MAFLSLSRPASSRKSSRMSLRHMFQVARSRRALHQLDDVTLRDIGLSREEARTEAKRPFWDAPNTWRY